MQLWHARGMKCQGPVADTNTMREHLDSFGIDPDRSDAQAS